MPTTWCHPLLDFPEIVQGQRILPMPTWRYRCLSSRRSCKRSYPPSFLPPKPTPPLFICAISVFDRASCFLKSRMQASIAPSLLAAATHLAGGTSFASSGSSGETDAAVADDDEDGYGDGCGNGNGYEIARPLHVGFISKLFEEEVGERRTISTATVVMVKRSCRLDGLYCTYQYVRTLESRKKRRHRGLIDPKLHTN